ncbi:7250_t:CDS:2 [Ambispora gerdemannii]|uniref:7250_t:CDS:1 n=1 Tax=Ambispora gerdemannii TaxID=144530 RepID=A0A9N8VLC4_9GLOM|nr:7250_t:CDS:2 [Ambispora gerdemannii]
MASKNKNISAWGYEALADYISNNNASEVSVPMASSIADIQNNAEDELTWENVDSAQSDFNSTNSISTSETYENDYIISETLCNNFVPCVLMDVYNGELKRCPNYEKPGHQLRPL